MYCSNEQIYEISKYLSWIFKMDRRTVTDLVSYLAHSNQNKFEDEIQTDAEDLILKAKKMQLQVRDLGNDYYEIWQDGDTQIVHRNFPTRDYLSISVFHFINSRRIQSLMLRAKVNKRIAVEACR